jgi:hypothetical protein
MNGLKEDNYENNVYGDSPDCCNILVKETEQDKKVIKQRRVMNALNNAEG